MNPLRYVITNTYYEREKKVNKNIKRKKRKGKNKDLHKIKILYLILTQLMEVKLRKKLIIKTPNFFTHKKLHRL